MFFSSEKRRLFGLKLCGLVRTGTTQTRVRGESKVPGTIPAKRDKSVPGGRPSGGKPPNGSKAL